MEKNPEWSLARLASEGFKPKVIEAVDAMTRRREESYNDFVLRAAANPTSRAVKLADLKDNVHMAHIAGRDDSKYRNAIELISRLLLDKGDVKPKLAPQDVTRART